MGYTDYAGQAKEPLLPSSGMDFRPTTTYARRRYRSWAVGVVVLFGLTVWWQSCSSSRAGYSAHPQDMYNRTLGVSKSGHSTPWSSVHADV